MKKIVLLQINVMFVKIKKVSVQLNVNNSFIAEQCNFCRHTDKP